MPTIIHLKEPPIGLASKDTIEDIAKNLMDLGVSSLTTHDQEEEKPICVITTSGCNIAYLVELSVDEYEKVKAENEARRRMKQQGQGQGIIDPVHLKGGIKPVFPGRGRGGRN